MKKIVVPGLVAGLLMLVVGMVVSQLLGLVLPNLMAEYQTPGLFRPWADPLMQLYFLHPFVVGLILAWAYGAVKTVVQGSTIWQKGACFGAAYWLLVIPGMLMSYACFPLSLAMVLSWTVSILVQAICAGVVLAKMNG